MGRSDGSGGAYSYRPSYYRRGKLLGEEVFEKKPVHEIVTVLFFKSCGLLCFFFFISSTAFVEKTCDRLVGEKSQAFC